MLTDRTIKALKAPATGRTELYDAHARGLSLRVTANGVKSWLLRFRVGGQQMPRLTLGQYPTVGLEAARKKKAQRALRAVDGGANPAAEKKAVRQGELVADLAKEYIERHAKKFKKSWREDERMLDADVLPLWRNRTVKELTRRDVRILIEAIADRGSPIVANRCLALVRKMLNFAVQRDWVDANVASLMAKPGAEQSRDRVLTADEIRRVWAACAGERPALCAVLKLRLVLAQRASELAQLRWTDIDFETGWITFPPAVTKNGEAHRVPITPPALDLLTALPQVDDCEWVFPGRTARQPLGDMKKGGQRIAKRVLAQLQTENPTVTAFNFQGRDLRRTASTFMAEAGISQADIAKVLNHVEDGPRATHVYNRYQYDKEKQIALTTWSRKLTEILENTDAKSNVIPMTKKGA